MDIEKLERDYQNFYTPTFKILVGENGDEKERDIVNKGVEVTNVIVDNTLDGADTFSFTVFNAFDITNKELLWFGGDDSLFKFGEQVEIKLGYANNIKTLMIGLITSVKVDFPSGSPPQIEVSGFDLSYKMMKDKKTRSEDNYKDSEMVQKIAEDYCLTAEIEDTEVTYPQIIKQEKESDFAFLMRLAERNHYEFFVFRETLFFRKPAVNENQDPVVTLEWGKSLVSFSPKIDIAERVEQINVIGQNTDDNKKIKATAKMPEDEITKNFNFDKEQFITEQVKHTLSSEQHAETLARSILLKKYEDVFTASGESMGIPVILAGENIELKGLGTKFSQTYYINQTNHSISSSGYKTTFNVKILPDRSKIEVSSETKPLSSGEKETETNEELYIDEKVTPPSDDFHPT